MASRHIPFKMVILESKDGEWGKDQPFDDSIPMRVIRGADFDRVRIGDIDKVPLRYIPRKAAEKKTLQPDDIVIETAGGTKDRPTGRTLLLRASTLHKAAAPITCASFSRFIRIDSEAVEPEYVFWYLQYLYRIGVMEEHQVQHTGVSRFQYTRFSESLQIPAIARSHQRGIADILGSIEERIRFNHEMNKSLESMCSAIFKSWFVDFDPVRANAVGKKPFGMGDETAALFPDSFEDSEREEIPKGWRVTTLGEILSRIESGRRPKGGAGGLKTGVPSIGAENVDGLGKYKFSKEKFVSEQFYEEMKTGKVRSGDILLYKDGAYIGKLSMVLDDFPHKKCCVNEHVFILRTNKECTHDYLYFWLNSPFVNNCIRNLNTGCAQPGLNTASVRSVPILLPPIQILGKFEEMVAPIMKMIFCNAKSAITLQELRDALLPRLLSGEIRIPANQAEQKAEWEVGAQ